MDIDIEGVISSEPNRVPMLASVYEPKPHRLPYYYQVITLYITKVIEGEEHIKPGDTIILHDYYHLAPNLLDDQQQPGMTFHLRGLYQVDIGVMYWAEFVEHLGKSAMYEPSPVVGKEGDVVRIILQFEFLAINTVSGTIVSDSLGDVTFRLIDENWAQVVSGSVRMGKVINLAHVSVETLGILP